MRISVAFCTWKVLPVALVSVLAPELALANDATSFLSQENGNILWTMLCACGVRPYKSKECRKHSDEEFRRLQCGHASVFPDRIRAHVRGFKWDCRLPKPWHVLY